MLALFWPETQISNIALAFETDWAWIKLNAFQCIRYGLDQVDLHQVQVKVFFAHVKNGSDIG